MREITGFLTCDLRGLKILSVVPQVDPSGSVNWDHDDPSGGVKHRRLFGFEVGAPKRV